MAKNIFKKNVFLKNFTTYKIGGPAKYFFSAKTKEDIVLALAEAKKMKLPVFILGGGSNLLISDKGFKGLVLQINNHKFEISDSGQIYADAGVPLMKLAYLASDKGFSGLEWAAGIPGTVGGAIYGHAQAFGTRMSDSVKSVQAINLKTLELKDFTKEECTFSLKNSLFKKNKNWVIVSAVLEVKKADLQEINSKIKDFLYHRKTKHPISFPSAGSTFVNPEKKITNKKLLEKFPELAEYNKFGIIPAGFMIAKCGLAGKKKGKAQISEKHCNFIINLGGAKAKDIVALMNLAKAKVKQTFKINLQSEVQLIGL